MLPYKQEGVPICISVDENTDTTYIEEEARYNVGPNWRIIGTMNIYDMHMLYELSYAFMRRFAFIDVDVPDRSQYRQFIEKKTNNMKSLFQNMEEDKTDQDYNKKIVQPILDMMYFDEKPTMLQQHRKIGPAIVKDILEYVDLALKSEKTFFQDIYNAALAQAITIFLLPQFEGMLNNLVQGIYNTNFKKIDKQGTIKNRLLGMFPEIQLDW